MKPYATLITFATGAIYERYAAALLQTADRWFFPGKAQHLTLQTPYAGLYAIRDRHTHILKHRAQIKGRFVFFLDADMLFEGPVADEIVADGVTATLHPVQNTHPIGQMTYERNPDSAAYVPHDQGASYYVGAILGAPRATFLDLSSQVDRMCREDGDYIPVWQDESYLNRILIDQPPALELDGRYCAWWNHHVDDARIRALNKTVDEFRWRDSQQPEPRQPDGPARGRSRERGRIAA